jgi:trk system potassium uptake protein TrkA
VGWVSGGLGAQMVAYSPTEGAQSVEHTEISFIPLLVVIALAFLVPLLLSHLKGLTIPIVVGEIIAGIIVGQSGLNLVQEGPVLRILSILGFAYLMFLSGLEIDFSDILRGERNKDTSKRWPWLHNPFVVGGVLYMLTLLGSAVAAFFLRNRGLVDDSWIMALILSTTSLGVVVPVLKERGLTSNRYGQTILIAALIADFASILLISIYVLLHGQGLTAEILLVLVLFVAFVAVHRLAILFQRHLPTERIFEELSSATSQIRLRGSFALALIFIALAESLGIENILGAFLAGVIISLLSSKGEGSILQEKLDAIGYGFFIPIFFIMVGVDFDLPALLSSRSALFLVPLLIGIAYLVKSVPALIYRLEYSWRETLAASVLLSSRLSLIIAASAIGLELGIISDAVNSAVILVAVITCILSPILFNRLLPDQGQVRDRVIVVGSRQSAELLRRRLGEHNLDAVLISGNSDQTQRVLVTGDSSPWSQQTLLDELRQAEIERAQAVVAIAENDEDNLRICRIARCTYGVENVIAWVQDPSQNERFRRLRVRVVNPAYSTVLIIEGMVLNPDVFSLTADMDKGQEVRETKLQNLHLVSRRLDDLMLPGDVIVLMIERGGDILIPDRETILRANDTVTLVGADTDVDDAARLFARNGR